jgi:hypothetical protein
MGALRQALILACAASTLPLVAGAAGSCAARSGEATAALVELYTSEGCSSCPPADRWLSTLREGAVVPLALHVDYWDSIGWRDRFADPRFSRRQREAVRRGGGRVAYTPQVVVDGHDFRRWHEASAFERAVKAVTARPPQAALELTAEQGPAGAWTATLSGKVAARPGRAEAYLALYESGLETDVRAGENQGARLRHDYVVRRWIGPIPVGADGKLAIRREFPADAGVDVGRAGVAGFVQDPDSGRVLQAIALRFCTR